MFHLFESPSSYAARVKFDRESAKRDKCCPCERQTKCLEIWILLMSSLPPSGVVIAAQTCKISGDLEGPFVKIGLALLPSLPPIIWRVPFAASGRPPVCFNVRRPACQNSTLVMWRNLWSKFELPKYLYDERIRSRTEENFPSWHFCYLNYNLHPFHRPLHLQRRPLFHPSVRPSVDPRPRK